MPIYKMTIAGRRKPLLVKADSAAKAKDLLVTAVALSSEDMADAIEAGERVWKPEDELPEDDPAPDEKGLPPISEKPPLHKDKVPAE